MEGAQVSLKVNSYYYNRFRVFTAITGKNGVAEFPLKDAWNLSRSSYFYHYVIGRKGEHHGLVRKNYFYKQNYNRGNYRIYPITDRPLYKPGDKVNFKVIVRRFQKEKYVNFDNQSLRIVIQDPRANKVFDKYLITNSNGAVAHSFSLPKKTTLGLYQIYTYIGKTYAHVFNGQYQLGKFRVEEYKEPAYKVAILSPQGQFFSGDTVKVKVRAKYYFGGPLRMAKVKYNIYRKAYYWPAPISRYANVRYGRPRYSKRRYYRRYYWNPMRKVGSGTGITNEKGEVELLLKTLKAQGNQQYQIKVEVVDKSRRSILASKNIIVTQKGFSIKVHPTQYIVKMGQKAQVALQVETASHFPIATTGLVQIYLQQKDKKKIAFVKKDSFKARTGKNGKATFEYIPKEEGYYKFVFSTADQRDHRITGETTLWVAGRDYQGRGYQFQKLSLIPQKKEYESNEKALILLNSPKSAVSALVVVSGNQHIFYHKVIQLTGESQLFSLELKDNYAPNVYVSALVLTSDRQLLRTQINLKVRPYSKKLQVQLISSKKEYGPGEEAVLEVTIKDYQGQPVSTESCISVVDTSLFYLQPELVKNIRQYFYNYQRKYHLTVRNSFDFYSTNQFRWELGFKPHYWRTRANLPSWIRSRSYFNFSGFNANSHLWLELIHKPKPKPVAKGGKPSRPLAVPGREESSKDEKSKGAPSRIASRKTSMSNSAPSMSKKSRGFGGGRSKKKQASSPGSKNQSSPTFKKATLRKNFANLAFWSAFVKTDSRGKGSIRFKLPDKLTTWKATFRSATSDSKFGEGVLSFQTRKLLMIRLQAPRFFTERDQVILSGVIHNYLPVAKKIKIVLKLSGKCLALNQVEGSKDPYLKETIISLKPKKDYRIDWLVDVKNFGRATVEVQALRDTESDAMKMTFPVFRHGIEKFHGQSLVMMGPAGKPALSGGRTHTLNVPKERIVSSTELRVVLSPSVASVMLESLPYLASYPYGCVYCLPVIFPEFFVGFTRSCSPRL